MKKLLTLAAAAIVMVSCVDKSYDSLGGTSTKVTLFSQELSMPLGSLDTIRFGTLINKLLKPADGSQSTLFDLKADESGEYYYSQSKKGFEVTGLALYYNYSVLNQTTPVDGGKATIKINDYRLFSALETGFVNQRLLMTLTNPLDCDVTVSFSVNVTDADGNNVDVIPEDSHTYGTGETADLVLLTGIGEKLPQSITISNIKVSVPESYYPSLQEHNMDVVKMNCEYRTGVFIASDFSLPYTFKVAVNQEIGKYKFHELELNGDVENALPVSAGIKDFWLSTNDTTKVEIRDVTLEMPDSISGGSLKAPSKTHIKATFKSEEAIPDIENMNFTINIHVGEGGHGEPLNAKEYIVLNGLEATLRGGVTLL